MNGRDDRAENEYKQECKAPTLTLWHPTLLQFLAWLG
jgi:hypothetical protein